MKSCLLEEIEGGLGTPVRESCHAIMDGAAVFGTSAHQGIAILQKAFE